jgi:hypothetical protein
MAARRVNPCRIKLHRCYSVNELAERCDVHRNTVRHWQGKGLQPIDDTRPALFLGATAREFLAKARASRKRPCPPGTIYCFRCRQPRAPASGMVDYLPKTALSGNLQALCECCETLMNRRVRQADIGKIMPGLSVQITHGQLRLSGKANPSLNCDSSEER